MSIPYLAVGNEELGKKVGDKAKCPKCKKMHVIEYGERKKGNKWIASTSIGVVTCKGEAYLVAINGREFRSGR